MNAQNHARFYYSTLITSAVASLFITVGITSFVVGCSGSSNTDLTGDGGSNGGGGGGGGLAGIGAAGGGGGGGGQQKDGNQQQGANGTMTPPSNAPGAAAGATDAQCSINTNVAACDTCVAEACCNEVKACKANSACIKAWNCAAACPAGDRECVNDCLLDNPAGQADVQALAQCGNGMCGASCN